jgi:hypothetical protein
MTIDLAWFGASAPLSNRTLPSAPLGDRVVLSVRDNDFRPAVLLVLFLGALDAVAFATLSMSSSFIMCSVLPAK